MTFIISSYSDQSGYNIHNQVGCLAAMLLDVSKEELVRLLYDPTLLHTRLIEARAMLQSQPTDTPVSSLTHLIPPLPQRPLHLLLLKMNRVPAIIPSLPPLPHPPLHVGMISLPQPLWVLHHHTHAFHHPSRQFGEIHPPLSRAIHLWILAYSSERMLLKEKNLLESVSIDVHISCVVLRQLPE